MKIKTIENVLSKESFLKLKEYILNFPESEWSLMNEPEINGEFWNNKRAMVPQDLVQELKNYIFKLELDFTNHSAINKIQRFFFQDQLGPIIDKEHVSDLKFGLVYFISENEGSQVSFPNINTSIKAKENTLVIYNAEEEYLITGPDILGEKLLFMTFFLN